MNSAIYRTQLTNGIFSRIARSLGLSRNHVREVAKGNRRSSRVESALEAEFARIERKVERFGRKRNQGKVEAAA